MRAHKRFIQCTRFDAAPDESGETHPSTMERLVRPVMGVLAFAAFYFGGMLYAFAILALEIGDALRRRRRGADPFPGGTLLCVSAGMLFGGLLSPLPSTPRALGVGALLLVIVIHGAVYTVAAQLMKPKS